MADDIIVTEGLTKRFPPDITAVDGLDLAVHAGEIFGLLGPNGAGKSTTIGMLTTRVTPTSGRASVGGVDVIARPAVAKQVIGVVPQTNTLDRAMTVFENLEFHGRYFGMSKTDARREANEFLERVRLADRAVGSGHGPLGWYGPTIDGGAGDHASTTGAVPRRADRGPRSPEPARAVGNIARVPPRRSDHSHHHAPHGRSRSAV